MKKLIGLIVLFIIAAIILTLIQYFERNGKVIDDTKEPATISSSTITIDKNPLLSPAQETALQKIGIDPASLSTKITPEMETCFVSKIGAQRVSEIKAGGLPTAGEVIIAKTCLSSR